MICSCSRLFLDVEGGEYAGDGAKPHGLIHLGRTFFKPFHCDMRICENSGVIGDRFLFRALFTVERRLL